MISILTKPIEILEKTDLESVFGWPEGARLEFKKDLPSNRVRDSWYDGGDVGDKAKTAIFKELVAFANTSGGRLLVGVEQSPDNPPIATALHPIPRCEELAERLERSASSSIDPPIPLLRIVGVKTDSAGNGIVVAHIPASHLAPHRSNNDLEWYVRRGANSVRISMREIQSLALQLSRKVDEITARFESAQRVFNEWLLKPDPSPAPVLGLRVTAVPIGARMYIQRVFKNSEVIVGVKEFSATLEETPGNVPPIRIGLSPFLPGGLSERPMIRASRRQVSVDEREGYYDVCCDGVVEISAKRKLRDETENRMYLSWICSHLANVMLAAETFASAAGVGEPEYGIEAAVSSYWAGGKIRSLPIHGLIDSRAPMGMLEEPIVLPRRSEQRLSCHQTHLISQTF